MNREYEIGVWIMDLNFYAFRFGISRFEMCNLTSSIGVWKMDFDFRPSEFRIWILTFSGLVCKFYHLRLGFGERILNFLGFRF